MGGADTDHLQFVEIPTLSGRRTKIWQVRDHTGARLGGIAWYAQWRRFVFYPVRDSHYDALCLHRIGNFCGIETKKRKKERAKERDLLKRKT